MNLQTTIAAEQQALPGLTRVRPANEYDEINAFLSEMALEHFQGLMQQADSGPSAMEQAAAAPNYLRSVHALQECLELQLATSHFPETELEEVRSQVQVAGIMGRPKLLRQEYHLVQRVLKERLRQNLYYLESMNLRLRGCTGEAQARLDQRLLELQLQLEQYQEQPAPEPAPPPPLALVRPPREQVAQQLRFSELVALYIDDIRNADRANKTSKSTIKKYRMQLDLITRLLDDPLLDELTLQDASLLEQRLQNLPKNFRKISRGSALRALVDTPDHGQPLMGDSTRASYQARARQLFRFAYREHYTGINLAG